MVKITSDSTCDLPPAVLAKMGIDLMPIPIVVDGVTYHDGVDITPQTLFEQVEMGKTCRTSAANSYEYGRFFEKALDGADSVIHFSLSSGFSSCHQNALLAAEGFSNVHVVDTQNLSSGSGHVVLDAAEMAEDDASVEDILEITSKNIGLVEASFVIDSIDYLYRGGRCSGLEAIGAKMLRIKPCIEVRDGRMQVGKKYRGKFHKALESYVEDRLTGREDIDYSRVFITHPMCSDETVETVRAAIREYADFDEIIVSNAGCTVSCHCGANTLGILFKRKGE